MIKQKWLKFEWPGYHMYQAIAPMKAWMFDFAKYGCPITKMAATYSKGTTCFCLLQDEYEKSGMIFFDKVKNNPRIMYKVIEEVKKAAGEIFKLEKKFDNLVLSSLSDKELLKIHGELFKWDEILWRKGQIQNLLEFHNNHLTVYVKNLIVNKFGNAKEADYFSALTVSGYQTVSARQDKDFLKLVSNYKNGKVKDINTEIKKHWQKYKWMIYGWTGPALDYDYFYNNFQEIIKQKKFVYDADNKEGKKAEDKVNFIINNLPEKNRKLTLLLRALLEAKAVRVDAHSLTYYLGDKIRAEIAKRVYISQNQMLVVPPLETHKLFKGANQDILNEDINFHLYWFEKGRMTKLTGHEALRKFVLIKKGLPRPKKTNELKGELAYPGKVRGKVKIILEKKDFDKFKKGEILVTRITDPNYVPIMKIARAIITEVGGVTSHAAIVARELKKPCIIGTKIATQILKDGDMVEVDAGKGIVKKIK